MTIVQTISTFSALLPILVGSKAFRISPLLRLFWLFLIFGFSCDVVVMTWNYYHEPTWLRTVAVIIHNLYSLVDAVFLFYFLTCLSNSTTFRKISKVLCLGMIPFWFISYFVLKDAFTQDKSMSAIYDSSYELLLAISYAGILLEITRSNATVPTSILWVCVGVFFYNFCGFFVQTFIEDSIINNIYFLHSVINIISNVVYALAFMLLYKEKSIDAGVIEKRFH